VLGIAALVLAIACVNLASLALAPGGAQSRNCHAPRDRRHAVAHAAQCRLAALFLAIDGPWASFVESRSRREAAGLKCQHDEDGAGHSISPKRDLRFRRRRPNES